MTLNSLLNVSETISCNIHVNNRIDCIGIEGGNKDRCLTETNCCYNSDIPGETANETINPLLTTVSIETLLTEIYSSI